MKIILGDNQFFGVNHFDLGKGQETQRVFEDVAKIESFISSAHDLGIDGFMINSNDLGYQLIDKSTFTEGSEIHYSIPYPHKYANMVNEKGMLSLGMFILGKTTLWRNITALTKCLLTKNVKYMIPAVLDIEVPKGLVKGSYVYMQNIITDLLLGLGREDLIISFIDFVRKKGYKPGLITLNPLMLNKCLAKNHRSIVLKDLIVCFNINKNGFNVFPSLREVEGFIYSGVDYKLMGMSIFSSGASEIPSSIEYIKKMPLDYVVFGSSKLSNIDGNMKLFRSDF